MNPITSLEEDIKSLKIQGATNVALKVIEGLSFAFDQLHLQKNLDPHISLLEQTIRLAFTRPTEPLAQNAIRFIFEKKQPSPHVYLSLAEDYKKMIKDTKAKVAKFGVNLIKTGETYITHCHSSTVTNLFIMAHKKGKKFKIIATETRPNFQGRITVRELIENGIEDVTMIVDNMTPALILENKTKIDGIFIGSDLLSEKGFVNKIGSLGIAYLAHAKNIPLFCLSSLLKYDPRPFSDNLIETRSATEIWKDAPEKLKFISPAFDFIPYFENITFVTEIGLFKGSELKHKALELYPFLNFRLQTP